MIGEMKEAEKTKLDIVLLNVSIPGKNESDIANELKKRFPNVGTVVLRMHPEDHLSAASIHTGDADPAIKGSGTVDLVNAMDHIYSGEGFANRAVAVLVADPKERRGIQVAHEKLSDRESEVLYFIASGKKVREIASDLALSLTTVATYRARILKKMNLKSNVDLANYMLRNNLME